MLKNIDHIAFVVSDLDRSLNFYQDILGLKIILRRVWDEEYVQKMIGIQGASLDIALLELPGEGSPILELIEYENPKGIKTQIEVNTIGNAHLCFMVESMAEIFKRLQHNGIEFLSEPVTSTAGPNKGKKAIYLRDPDNIIIQLLQPQEGSPL